MKEYFTERCNIEDENDIIQHYVAFGWNYEGSQEVFNEHQEADPIGDTIYFKTITNHYMSIKFSRDMEMPYYDDLKYLQNNTTNLIYSNSDLNKKLKEREQQFYVILGISIIGIIGGIFMAVGGSVSSGLGSIAICIDLILLSILINKSKKKIEQNISDNQTKIAMNFSKTEELLKK